MFHTRLYVFHMCIRFFCYLQVRIFLLSVFHKPQEMQECAVDREDLGTQCHKNVVSVPRASAAVPFSCSELLCSEYGTGFSPPKSIAWETSLLQSMFALFQRALLRRRSLSRGICQAVLAREKESLLSARWARGRGDISQALLQAAVSSAHVHVRMYSE